MPMRYKSEINEVCQAFPELSNVLQSGKIEREHIACSLNLLAKRGEPEVVQGMLSELVEIAMKDPEDSRVLIETLAKLLAGKEETVAAAADALIMCAEQGDIKGLPVLVDRLVEPATEEELYGAVLDYAEDILTREMGVGADEDRAKILKAVVSIKDSIVKDNAAAEEKKAEVKTATAAAETKSALDTVKDEKIDLLMKQLAAMKKALDEKNQVVAPAAKKVRGPNKLKDPSVVKTVRAKNPRKQAAPKKRVAAAAPIRSAPTMSHAAALMTNKASMVNPGMEGRIPVQMNGLVLWLTPDEIKKMGSGGTPPH